MKTVVILPTYNEKENMPIILEKLSKHDVKVVIVDDNSPDRTAEFVKEYMKKNKEVYLIERKKKEGLGKAYIEGMRYALKELKADIIFQMDADLSHDPEYIPKFMEEIKENDIVIGSRYIEGGDFHNWPRYRKLISRGANIYGQWILGIKVRDISSGYRCFRREILEKIDFDKFENFGYSFLEELLYYCIKEGGRAKEIPFVYKDRIKGETKLNQKEMINFFVGILKLRLKNGKA